MFVKGYMLDTDRVDALFSKSINPKDKEIYNMENVDMTFELIPRDAYKYLCLAEDANGERQFVLVLLDGRRSERCRFPRRTRCCSTLQER
jgi:hypothetical protein